MNYESINRFISDMLKAEVPGELWDHCLAVRKDADGPLGTAVYGVSRVSHEPRPVYGVKSE